MTIRVGDQIEAGRPGTEDYDTGRVVAIDGDTATVAWDQYVTTRAPLSDLRPSRLKAYRIRSAMADLGLYYGATEDDAIAAMLRDAGYAAGPVDPDIVAEECPAG